MGCVSAKEKPASPKAGGSTSPTSAKKPVTEEKKDYSFKLLMVGEAGVGKSSLLLHFMNGSFPESTVTTVETEFLEKSIDTPEGKIMLQTFDTAGQEKFRTMTSSYYRNAEGVLICFDVSRKDTFDKLDKWVEQVVRYGPENCNRLFVGCKTDLAERQVTTEEAKKFAEGHEGEYIECSALKGEHIEDVFKQLAVAIRSQKEMEADD